MLHTKCQGSRPSGLRLEDFVHVFPIQAYVKHVTPGDNLNKLGRRTSNDHEQMAQVS